MEWTADSDIPEFLNPGYGLHREGANFIPDENTTNEADEKPKEDQLVYIDEDGKVIPLEKDQLVYIDEDGKIFPIERILEYSWEINPPGVNDGPT